MGTSLLHDGKIIHQGSREEVLHHLKTELPDGDYHLVGPRIDLTVWRNDGVLYPLRGVIDGEEIPARTKKQAKSFFKDYSPLV